MGTIATVVLLLSVVAILAVNIYMIVNFRKGNESKTVEMDVSSYRYANNAPDDIDDERFHLAPLGNLDEEYLNLFSNPPMDKPARRGKSAYLRDAYHERIRQIVNALNIDGVNISTYVDMVLTDHLMRYETQIDRLLNNCSNESLKKQKQWLPS